MSHKHITTNALFVFFLFLVTVAVKPVFAQSTNLTPSPTVPTLGPDVDSKVTAIEKRLVQLETRQSQTTESLHEYNERNKFMVTAFTAALGALVAIQSIVTFVQLRREGARESRQTQRDAERDPVQNESAKKVSEIMTVVNTTLKSRLDAEIEERKKAADTEKQLKDVLNDVKSLREFVNRFQSNIQNERSIIEDSATRLSQMPRHEFKYQGSELHVFARQFDTFQSTYEPIEEGHRHSFSTRALYIRGIAAHYANDPEKVKRHLTEVIIAKEAEAGEPDKSFKRRVANAHYYLGITELNFGNTQTAVDSFEQANILDPEGADFLTKLVTAEAYVMKGPDNFGKAKGIITTVESGLNQKKDNEGRLTGVYLHLKSRTSLIQANMTILKRDKGYLQVVRQLLEQTPKDDPGYYYATVTLAQAYAAQNSGDDAKRLFREAFEALEQSGDLLTVTEVRSQILVRMVAALCSRHGLIEKKRSDEHLDKADGLRGRLPKIGTQVCTVFSPLSKRNESGETIHEHIGLIRKGSILLEESSV